jgi:PAS domain S-box-containing protein
MSARFDTLWQRIAARFWSWILLWGVVNIIVMGAGLLLFAAFLPKQQVVVDLQFGFWISMLSTPIALLALGTWGGIANERILALEIDPDEGDLHRHARLTESTESTEDECRSPLPANPLNTDRQSEALNVNELLLAMMQAIDAAPDFDTALAAALQGVCQTTHWDYGEVWTIGADGQAIECSPIWYSRPDLADDTRSGLDEFRQYSEGLTFLPHEGLPGLVWQQCQPLWIEDVTDRVDCVFLREHLAQQCGLKAAFGVPILAPRGELNGGSYLGTKVIAVFVFFMFGSRQQDRQLLEVVSTVAAQLGNTLQQKQLNAELRALFAAMTDAIAVLDAQGYYLKVAPTYPDPVHRTLLGQVGKTVYDVFDRSLADTFVRKIWQALNTQKTVTLEYRIHLSGLTEGEEESETNRREAWFSCSFSPISEDSVIWISRDITEKKAARRERKQAEKALKEQKMYLQLVLDNIPQQVFWKDTDLVFRGCNKNWADAAGLSHPDAVIGKTDYDLLPSHEIAESFRSLDHQVIVTNTPQLHVTIAKQRPTVDGKITWLDVNRIPIRDANGMPLGVLGVLEDITLRKEAEEKLIEEQAKSERLLLNVLPKEIADRLKQEQGSIASSIDSATVLFADLVGFTQLSERLCAIELVSLLNDIFSCFDRLAERHGLEKIKTIGDAYMVVGGVPIPRPDRAEAVAQMAIDMQQAISQFRTDRQETFQLRIGINTGPVVAGVIGIKKFIYDLWGDTVNVASRMESTGAPGGIQVSASTYNLLKDRFVLKERGRIEVKGKGEMMTYWLVS